MYQGSKVTSIQVVNNAFQGSNIKGKGLKSKAVNQRSQVCDQAANYVLRGERSRIKGHEETIKHQVCFKGKKSRLKPQGSYVKDQRLQANDQVLNDIFQGLKVKG